MVTFGPSYTLEYVFGEPPDVALMLYDCNAIVERVGRILVRIRRTGKTNSPIISIASSPLRLLFDIVGATKTFYYPEELTGRQQDVFV